MIGMTDFLFLVGLRACVWRIRCFHVSIASSAPFPPSLSLLYPDLAAALRDIPAVRLFAGSLRSLAVQYGPHKVRRLRRRTPEAASQSTYRHLLRAPSATADSSTIAIVLPADGTMFVPSAADTVRWFEVASRVQAPPPSPEH